MKTTLKAIVATVAVVGLSTEVKAASANADAKQVVTEAISITKTADLDFGTAPQGDAAKTVAPADALAAAFGVVGNASQSYTVTLPGNSDVAMKLGAGGTADTEIAVSTFTSSSANAGALSSSGTDTLKVGASRAGLSATQSPGSYTAQFTVTVVY